MLSGILIYSVQQFKLMDLLFQGYHMRIPARRSPFIAPSTTILLHNFASTHTRPRYIPEYRYAHRRATTAQSELQYYVMCLAVQGDGLGSPPARSRRGNVIRFPYLQIVHSLIPRRAGWKGMTTKPSRAAGSE